MPATRRSLLLRTLAAASAWPAMTMSPRMARALSVIVFNGPQLRSALLGAVPGDTILLAPGGYGDAGDFIAPVGNVVLRAEQPLTAVLHSNLRLRAGGIVVDGLAFEGAGVELYGDGIHLTNCRLRGSSGNAIDLHAGAGVRISHCEIAEFRGRGITVRLGHRYAVRSPQIDHNLIRDARGRTGSEGNEGIQLGQAMKDSNQRLGAVVEHNLLQRVEGESEAISVKCSGNIIRFNTLADSRASIVNRHGEENTYQGNTVERAFGITIHDRGNRVIGNRCTGSLTRRSIRIMGGNIAADSLRQGGHPQAIDTLVEGNVADWLVVGDFFSSRSLPALNTMIVNHAGPIVYRNEVGTQTVNSPGQAGSGIRVGEAKGGPRRA